MDLCKGYTQGGSNADIVLADTFLKGFTNGIDWDTGYEAVLKDAQGTSSLSLPYKKDGIWIIAYTCYSRTSCVVYRGTWRTFQLEHLGIHPRG